MLWSWPSLYKLDRASIGDVENTSHCHEKLMLATYDLVLSLHVMTTCAAWGHALATPWCQLSWYSPVLSNNTVQCC